MPSASLDRTDRAILAELQQDARLSVRALAERLHLSRTAAHARLQSLIQRGVITGFAASVDRQALGLAVAALVIVRIEESDWQSIASEIESLPYVDTVMAVSGDVDFVVTVSVPDHATLSSVILQRIHAIKGVTSTRSYIILEERRGPGAPDPE
ncbi:Leucine-responsive regulatory protein [Pseudoclavibacter triregionum]|nr:Leucine-responsive regulatory protein [Pseudoclavibacter triregionum]